MANVIPDYRTPNSIRLAISPLPTSYVEVWDGFERIRDLVSTRQYEKVKEGGWHGLDLPEEYGGQNLPYVMGISVGEILMSANMAFNMYQGLTHGAINALLAHASPEQKDI